LSNEFFFKVEDERYKFEAMRFVKGKALTYEQPVEMYPKIRISLLKSEKERLDWEVPLGEFSPLFGTTATPLGAYHIYDKVKEFLLDLLLNKKVIAITSREIDTIHLLPPEENVKAIDVISSPVVEREDSYSKLDVCWKVPKLKQLVFSFITENWRRFFCCFDFKGAKFIEDWHD